MADELGVEDGTPAVQPEEVVDDVFLDVPGDATDTEPPPEEPVVEGPSKAELALRNDLIQERANRRAAEDKAKFLEDFNKGQEAKKTEPEYDEEDFLTGKQVSDIIDRKVGEKLQEINAGLEKDKANSRTDKITADEVKMKEVHSDYDDIFKKYIEPKLASDPDFVKMLEGVSNAPQAAYNWAMTQPEVVQQKINTATIKSSAKAKVNTLADVGSGTPGGSPKPFDANDLSEEAFQKLLHKIRTS